MPEPRGGVLILYNVPRTAGEAAGLPCVESDAGVLEEVEAVGLALRELCIPFRSAGIRCLTDLPAELSCSQERTVFNLVEALRGDPNDLNLVPSLCRAYGKGCTGSDTPALVACLDKWRTKAVLRAAGVAVPEAVLIADTQSRQDAPFPDGPVIVKPALADASEGVDADSVFAGPDRRMHEHIDLLRRHFSGPILVERYVDGREINVSILERQGRPEVLAVAEIEFADWSPNAPRIVGYRAKWLPDAPEYVNTLRRIPTDLPAAVEASVRDAALRSWQALGCRGYARADLRLDADLQPWVLEVNTNPDISPEGGYRAALEAAGVPFTSFVRTVLKNALGHARDSAEPAAPPPSESVSGDVTMRWSKPGDRGSILEMAAATRSFRPDELEVAREVLDDALREGPDGHYQSYTALVEGRPTGWACFGPTPCAIGTYDLYWILVAPDRQGCGVGRALIALAEATAASRAGRLMIAETSGRDSHGAARRFYRRAGYVAAARLPDFYGPGDDKVIFTKDLSLAPTGRQRTRHAGKKAHQQVG